MTHSKSTPFYLIVGCPRSGTSLLAGELARRFDLVIPFETHFVPIFKRWLGLYGDLQQPRNRHILLRDIYLFTRMWLRASKTFDQEKIAHISILSTETRTQDIVDQSCDYASLCRAIFEVYAQGQGAARFADKSVFFSPVPVQTLSGALGDIKIINVVRDGRDVYLSWTKTWFGAGSSGEAARLWSRHVQGVDRWAKDHPGKVMTVRYEDLITAPDDVFSAIGEFWHLTPRVGDASALSDAMSSAREHSMLGQGINADNLNKHVTALPADAARRFVEIAGEDLKRHGYDTAQGQGRLQKERAWGQGLGRALVRWPQHMVKFNMPLLFACGGRVLCRYLTRKLR